LEIIRVELELILTIFKIPIYGCIVLNTFKNANIDELTIIKYMVQVNLVIYCCDLKHNAPVTKHTACVVISDNSILQL